MNRHQIAFDRENSRHHSCRGNSRTALLPYWHDRERIMSRAQFCDSGSLERRSNKSNAPYFRKRLTSAMLESSHRVIIPRHFVLKHGDRFHGVLSLTGPNRKSRSVTLNVRGGGPGDRTTYLCSGWIHFARENGFQRGDEVIFRLVANSSFRVVLCRPQSLEKATSTRTNSSEGGEADGTSEDGVVTSELAPEAHDPKLARQDLRKGTSGSSITNHEETQILPCHVNSNTVESQVPPSSVEAVPPQKWNSKVREEDYFKYPGLNSAVTANSRFPQFVKRLTPCSLKCKHSIGPEIPSFFVKKNGDKFRERVTLLGASDHLRVVNLSFSTGVGRGRVYLGKGWEEFSLENEYSEGDALLFSLVGDSTFVVKMFPEVS